MPSSSSPAMVIAEMLAPRVLRPISYRGWLLPGGDAAGCCARASLLHIRRWQCPQASVEHRPEVPTTVFTRHFSCRSRAEAQGAGRALAKAQDAGIGAPAIPSYAEIRELATMLRVKPKELFKSLGGFQENKKHRIVLSGKPYAFPKLGNIIIPFEDARKAAKRFGKTIVFLDVEQMPKRSSISFSTTPCESAGDNGRDARRPVVVLLGHFNHGKTSILDALLGPASDIVRREAGGITQEIRARTIVLGLGDVDKSGEVATVVDTPGQEIFYRMRTNGARIADAVILVVSAADGVCLQTAESIGCAEELGLPVVVALNKVDLISKEVQALRFAELSEDVRSYVALEKSRAIPVSAYTGYGLDELRKALAEILLHESARHQRVLSVEDSGPVGSVTPEREVEDTPGATRVAAIDAVTDGSEPFIESMATATVLDCTTSARTGKMLLLLIDRGVLRPGDFFVAGLMWGSVRQLYDEEGTRPINVAGPGTAVMVAIAVRTNVFDAPLGEPFRVVCKEAAEKVASVRGLARTIGDFIDHQRLEKEFRHPLSDDEHNIEEEATERPDMNAVDEAAKAARGAAEDPEPLHAASIPQSIDDLAQEDMPVTIVVKADSANTLASILDALGDWGEEDNLWACEGNASVSDGVAWRATEPGSRKRQDGSAHDLKHKPRRLLVSVARSGVGAVTSSDVSLARDCECPVFAHSVKADASAKRELKRVGGGIISALKEGAAAEVTNKGIGGQEGFIGRAGLGRECVVVSETVSELLGEIERFVLRVR